MNDELKKYNYDVVLSFAGENREYVEDVARGLKKLGIYCFYDKDKEIEIWGKDLPQFLQQVYSSGNVKYCVVFISEFYSKKYFPQFELRSALVRDLTEYGFILPVRLDDSDPPPGILPTKAYIDARSLTPANLVEKISKKLNMSSTDNENESINYYSDIPKPRIPETEIDLYKEAESVVEHIITILENRGKSLKSNKLNFVSNRINQKNVLQVTYNNEVIYSLYIWIGGSIGKNDISFYHSHGDLYPNSNSMTGIGTIEWNKDRRMYLVHVNNYSLLSYYGIDLFLTKEEIADKLWDEIVKIIERAFDINP